jgi:uncharacterized membrane protein YdbT with pleckstrin-like domain
MKPQKFFSMKNAADPVFMGQNEHEEVLEVLRRGFIIELQWIIPVIIGYFLILFGNPLFDVLEQLPFTEGFTGFVRLLLFLFLSVFALNRFSDWFYSVNVITNQRILDFEFYGLGYKKIVETELRNIQSVTIKSSGFLSFIFGLATIQILTSGDNPNIDFEFIGDSKRIQDLVSDLARKPHHDKSHGKGKDGH